MIRCKYIRYRTLGHCIGYTPQSRVQDKRFTRDIAIGYHLWKLRQVGDKRDIYCNTRYNSILTIDLTPETLAAALAAPSIIVISPDMWPKRFSERYYVSLLLEGISHARHTGHTFILAVTPNFELDKRARYSVTSWVKYGQQYVPEHKIVMLTRSVIRRTTNRVTVYEPVPIKSFFEPPRGYYLKISRGSTA